MKVSILTLFPEMFSGPFDYSIVKRAIDKKILKVDFSNIRDFGLGPHKQVDDRPHGGGVGMIMRVDVIDKALKHLGGGRPQRSGGHDSPEVKESKPKTRIILLDPKGKQFNQQMARRFSKLDHLILICGHYEGVDERVKKLVNEVISIGNYILTGGEIPAMIIVDAVTRLIPGVLSKKDATSNESFTSPIPNSHFPYLEYPQYTRPAQYRGMEVPKTLLSGNHKKIDEWRKKQGRES